ncbi:MAG: glutathione S-transferase family protein [Rhodobacter sp.]|uniref:glutathione S-transferase family protein n=1 Tax=Pararhodobacter sp. TaxID=2127056 RepID=UPI001DBDC28D|nr:glutathione S-transferase family protein [Pararhodobacter sp.]MCB1344630.1 glutathione S-transferase family protein [Paracoccaceae bacterium]MCC0073286.1 glutathione S-transferase family protein [Rhodobacter sp.]HPD92662.1 glutathione S-transferase family protein [Pararhodobacter sp.]
MLTIWGRTDSSNVQALMWCVAELGLPHRRIDAGHRFGGTDTPEFLAMNPNGTVPVLQDGDAPPLWETGAILRYLAGRYGPESFWPADPVARADVDRWAEWAKINIALGFTGPVFWPVWRFPESRDPVALERALSALDAKLRIAEDRLSRHPFLVGDTLTLADIQFGHILYRYFTIDIARPALPALASYCARLTERPAYRQHVMVSFEALRA